MTITVISPLLISISVLLPMPSILISIPFPILIPPPIPTIIPTLIQLVPRPRSHVFFIFLNDPFMQIILPSSQRSFYITHNDYLWLWWTFHHCMIVYLAFLQNHHLIPPTGWTKCLTLVRCYVFSPLVAWKTIQLSNQRNALRERCLRCCSLGIRCPGLLFPAILLG